jgi:hypothetical protein
MQAGASLYTDGSPVRTLLRIVIRDDDALPRGVVPPHSSPSFFEAADVVTTKDELIEQK